MSIPESMSVTQKMTVLISQHGYLAISAAWKKCIMIDSSMGSMMWKKVL